MHNIRVGFGRCIYEAVQKRWKATPLRGESHATVAVARVDCPDVRGRTFLLVKETITAPLTAFDRPKAAPNGIWMEAGV